jgi:hypothetical protein
MEICDFHDSHILLGTFKYESFTKLSHNLITWYTTLMKSLCIIISNLDSEHCDSCSDAIQALEQIDDDTDAVGVKFVKTDDASFAKEVGVKEFPAIVYFEKDSPGRKNSTNLSNQQCQLKLKRLNFDSHSYF